MDGIDEKRYLISIDGGGTNTGVCIYDRLQGISRTKIIGGGNYKTYGIDGAVISRENKSLRAVFQSAQITSVHLVFLMHSSIAPGGPVCTAYFPVKTGLFTK